ncbi:MAG TPA: hypothetical protein VGO50_19805 [Pyrinomonadaceae bacterium]|jgi:hypothetical protein|nr:hypothetical protein [Pyrinomonadaceae bacterium]
MSKKILLVLGSLLILSIFSTLAIAQETVTKTTTTTKKEVVQNPDGSWTVIEYPVNKEVVVQLTPTANFKGTGTAHIIRAADGTAVNLDLSGMPADMSKVYVYAVAPTGAASLLGPLDVVNGVASQSFSTPLNQFMLVLSPVENMNTFDTSSAVSLTSALPTGYAVVPRAVTSSEGSKQVATTEAVGSAYEVPLLNVPSFGDKTAEIRINFKGALSGLKGKAYIDNSKSGAKQIKMRFDDMKMAPKEKKLVLWASSPDGKYIKLGQVINSGKRQESEIRSETSLNDFGLFVTVEDNDVEQPTSTVYSVFGTGD